MKENQKLLPQASKSALESHMAHAIMILSQ